MLEVTQYIMKWIDRWQQSVQRKLQVVSFETSSNDTKWHTHNNKQLY